MATPASATKFKDNRMNLEQLKTLLAKSGVEFIITRKDGNLVHVNFWVEDEK